MELRVFSDIKVYIQTEDILKENVIYCLTFPNGKKYIGQTRNSLKARIKQHCNDSLNKNKGCFNTPKSRAIRKYLEFSVAVLYQGEELDNKEIWFINELDTLSTGYNLTEGGTNGYTISDESKSKMSEAALNREVQPMTGKKQSDETKKLISKGVSKATKQYDLKGELIREWESTKQAAEITGVDASSITKVVLGKRKSAGGYKWSNN